MPRKHTVDNRVFKVSDKLVDSFAGLRNSFFLTRTDII